MKSLFTLMVIVFLGSLASFSYAESGQEDSREGHERHESREYHTIHVLSAKTLKKKIVTKKVIKKSVVNSGTGATKPVITSTGTIATTQSATVSYNTPEGSVSVGFSVTVKGGIITAVSSTKKASGTSGYYQDSFAQGLSSVVGKKVVGLNLAAIGGASLTTAAFEKFVQQ